MSSTDWSSRQASPQPSTPPPIFISPEHPLRLKSHTPASRNSLFSIPHFDRLTIEQSSLPSSRSPFFSHSNALLTYETLESDDGEDLDEQLEHAANQIHLHFLADHTPFANQIKALLNRAKDAILSLRGRTDELEREKEELVCKSEVIEERNAKLIDELIDQKTLNMDLEQKTDKLHFLVHQHQSGLPKLEEESRAKAIQAQSEILRLNEQADELRRENGILLNQVKELSAMVMEFKSQEQESLLNLKHEIQKELEDSEKDSLCYAEEELSQDTPFLSDLITLKEACERTLNDWEHYQDILRTTYSSHQITRQIRHSLKGLLSGLEGHISCDQDTSINEDVFQMPSLLDYSSIMESPSQLNPPLTFQSKHSRMQTTGSPTNKKKRSIHIPSLQEQLLQIPLPTRVTQLDQSIRECSRLFEEEVSFMPEQKTEQIGLSGMMGSLSIQKSTQASVSFLSSRPLPYWMRDLRSFSSDLDFTLKGRKLISGVGLSVPNNDLIFSAEVDYFKDLRHLEKRVLVADSEHLYFFNAKSSKLIVKMKLSEVRKVLVLEKSGEVVVLEMERSHPYLLQTIYRLELSYFLVSTLNETLNTHKRVCFTEGVEFSKKGEKIDSILPLQENNHLSKLISNHNFGGAQQRASLWVLNKSKKWKKKMVALTELGLLLFSSLEDFQPVYVPLASASLNLDESSLSKLPDLPVEAEEKKRKGKRKQQPILEVRVGEMEPIRVGFNSFKERHNWVCTMKQMQKQEQDNKLRLFQ